MVRHFIFVPAVAILAACAPQTASVALPPQLARIPVERSLGDGNLRIVSLYRPEAEALLDSAGHSRAEMLDRLVRDVYAPWPRFWNGYLGDEAAFRTWADEALFDPSHPLYRTLPSLLEARLDSLFTASQAWLVETTGKTPRGTWYLVYGPGWTDMGGLGDIGMVADFTKQSTDAAALAFILPHELTHQVHGARAADPDAGTVLDRTISEGLATYAAWVHDGRRGSPAVALGYTEAEWTWSLAHERELLAAIAPTFDSRRRADLDRIASRSDRVLPNGPGAAGYFTGLRIVQAWVARHGDQRWADLLDLPVRRVLETSGYAP
jgi:hypothetical protein